MSPSEAFMSLLDRAAQLGVPQNELVQFDESQAHILERLIEEKLREAERLRVPGHVEQELHASATQPFPLEVGRPLQPGESAFMMSVVLGADGRIERDKLFMSVAHLFSQRSTCKRAKVGSVVVKDKRIISHGYNGAPPGLPHCLDIGCDQTQGLGGCTRTVHAEANAVAYAARSGLPLHGAVMFCTHGPCKACAGLLGTAGIRELVWDEEYRAQGPAVALLEEMGIRVRRYQP